MQDELAFGDALAALRRYSLISVADDAISLHRLVQAVARDRMGKVRRKAWVETSIALMHGTYRFNPHDMSTWPACAALLPHMMAAADLAATEAVENNAEAFVNNEIGFYLRQFGDLAAAQPFFERALAIREKALGPDHPDTATSLNNLGVLLRAMGDLAAARPFFERAYAIREKALGVNHPDTAQSIWWLGVFAEQDGDRAQARALYQQAFTIFNQILGPNHPTTQNVRRFLDNVS